MRVFISYRRDDTAGRAGRLCDGLAASVGQSNVFHDVGSIAPGVDFEAAILSALAGSDVTIVVIGTTWSTALDAHGRRRLDQPDDYVRLEVSAALASAKPVVPVLVGGAALPAVDDLPDDLRPLARRQAVSIRDATWHEDVAALARRLRGETNDGRRMRRLVLVLAVVAALVIGAVLVAVLRQRGDASGHADSRPPSCSAVDESWAHLVLSADPVGTYELADGTSRRIGYTVTAAATKTRQSSWRIIIDMEVANRSTPVDGHADDWPVDFTDFRRIVIDGLADGAPVCFGLLRGTTVVPPGQGAFFRMGFDTATDPHGAELILETAGTPITLTS